MDFWIPLFFEIEGIIDLLWNAQILSMYFCVCFYWDKIDIESDMYRS